MSRLHECENQRLLWIELLFFFHSICTSIVVKQFNPFPKFLELYFPSYTRDNAINFTLNFSLNKIIVPRIYRDFTSQEGALQADVRSAEEIRSEAEYQLNVWKGFLICIPYSSSIGGTATLTGTAPNLIMIGQLKR